MLSRRSILFASAAAALSQPMRALHAQTVATATVAERAVTVLSDGAFEMPLAMAARDIAPAEIEAVTRASGPLVSVLNVTCIRQGDATVMIDCGSGANFLPGTGKLGASLEQAGVKPESVTHVLFTHLHPDHFWGALDDFDTPLFPNAKWIADRREIAFWTDPKVYERLPEDRHAFAAGAQRIVKELGDRLEAGSPGHEWAPGIASFDTAGHTPGHVSFELNGADGPLFVLGDALTHPQISFARPQWRPASDHDGDLAVAARQRVLARATAEKAQVIGYHLPGALGRVERDGAAFRFVKAG